MAPPSARDFFVILYDLKAQSREMALNCLLKLLLYRRLSKPKDCYKLYLVNSEKTENNLKYDGISFIDAEVEINTIVDEILSVGTGESDWLEALTLGINELKAQVEESGIITLQLAFLTDLRSFKRPKNEKLLKEIVRNVKDCDIFLYIMGLDIKPPKTIFSDNDIKEWMHSVDVAETESNLKILKNIVNETPHSVVCTYDLGLHLFNSVKYEKGMQPWKEPLRFGSVITLPFPTIRITKPEQPFKLRNASNKPNDGVKWVYEDQEDIEVSFHDTVGGVVKHGKFVKIETSMFEIKNPACFSALGFTDLKNISEYLLQSDGSYLVIPDLKQPEGYLEFFYVLIDELLKLNKCIVAKKIYNCNSNATFVAMIPRLDSNIKGFILCDLPYADDIAYVYKEENISTPNDIEIDEKVDDFLDKINVSNSSTCKIQVPLIPKLMIDPNCVNIMKKAIEKTVDEKLLDGKIKLSPPDNLDFVENLKMSWPVRDLKAIKKEEDPKDDFNDVDDFDFS